MRSIYLWYAVDSIIIKNWDNKFNTLYANTIITISINFLSKNVDEYAKTISNKPKKFMKDKIVTNVLVISKKDEISKLIL